VVSVGHKEFGWVFDTMKTRGIQWSWFQVSIVNIHGDRKCVTSSARRTTFDGYG
jgi:hypothetical protein